MVADEEIRKRILDDLGGDTISEDPTYRDLSQADPEVLLRQARIHESIRRTAAGQRRRSWQTVFGLWLLLQAIPAVVIGLVDFYLVATDSSPDLLLGFEWVLAALIYWIPMLVAHSNDRTNKWAITCLNFLAGWTFIGWVIALVWSLMRDKPVTKQEV